MRRALFALLSALLVVCCAPLGHGQMFGGLTIRAETPSGPSSYGYAVYRFSITNPGTTDRSVRIQIDTGDAAIRSLSGTTTVPAGSTVELPIYQPPVKFQAYGARVIVDGRPIDTYLRLNPSEHGVEQYDEYYYYGYPSGRGQASHLVLLSPALPRLVADRIEDQLADPSRSSSGYGGSEETRRIEIASRPAAAWPANWLSYSRFLAIVMTASEYESLPAPVRDAVLGSVHAGGNLMLLDGPSPREGGLRELSDTHDLRWEQPESGGGQTSPWQAEADLGFGRVQWATTDRATAGHGGLGQTIFDRWRRTITPRDQILTLSNAEGAMSVVGEITVPRRMTFIFLVLFAILVCPLNLILLSKTNRRTLLFVSTPVLGLLFSLTVFAYGLLHDGIRTTSRLEAVSVLDQGSRFCSTSTQLGFYAPLTPGGLSFSNDTEVTPMLGRRGQRLSGDQRVSIEHGEAQQFRSGWISPREPAHFWLRTHTQRRERVLMQRSDTGEWSATNGLGVPISSFYFNDDAGNLYRTDRIEAGQQVALKLDPNPQAVGNERIDFLTASLLPSNATARLAGLRGAYRRPMSYVAVVEGRLFAPPGIESVGKRSAREVVIGLVGAEGRAQ